MGKRKKAISALSLAMLSLAAFAAIASDLSGFYALSADIDLGDATEKFFKAAIEVDVTNNEDP